MKSYIDYKEQLAGLDDVLLTVQTAEKLAAVHVHNTQLKIGNLIKLYQSLGDILSRLQDVYPKLATHPLLQKQNTGKKILVVLFGNKGLVGDLWHNMVDLVVTNYSSYDQVVVLGQKGQEYLAAERISYTAISPETNPATILQQFFSDFMYHRIAKVDILFPTYISLFRQQPTILQLFPCTFSPRNTQVSDIGIPLFSPSVKKIATLLLERYIHTQLEHIIVQTELSESSARMIASERAEEKTKQLIIQLKKAYLKERRKNLTIMQLESFLSHTL